MGQAPLTRDGAQVPVEPAGGRRVRCMRATAGGRQPTARVSASCAGVPWASRPPPSSPRPPAPSRRSPRQRHRPRSRMPNRSRPRARSRRSRPRPASRSRRRRPARCPPARAPGCVPRGLHRPRVGDAAGGLPFRDLFDVVRGLGQRSRDEPRPLRPDERLDGQGLQEGAAVVEEHREEWHLETRHEAADGRQLARYARDGEAAIELGPAHRAHQPRQVLDALGELQRPLGASELLHPAQRRQVGELLASLRDLELALPEGDVAGAHRDGTDPGVRDVPGVCQAGKSLGDLGLAMLHVGGTTDGIGRAAFSIASSSAAERVLALDALLRVVPFAAADARCRRLGRRLPAARLRGLPLRHDDPPPGPAQRGDDQPVMDRVRRASGLSPACPPPDGGDVRTSVRTARDVSRCRPRGSCLREEITMGCLLAVTTASSRDSWCS